MSDELHEVRGLFRDMGQARMAAIAAGRRGMDAANSDQLVSDAEGVHVVIRTPDAPEAARALLLEYGAYSATIAS